MTSTTPFGRQLKSWRSRRGLSQLELAVAAQTTPRYLSFIETGRARPGREVVLRVAQALGLSLYDQNALLESAGLPAAFDTPALDSPQMQPLRQIIDRILANHGHYPAWVMQGGVRFIQANATAEKLFPGMTTLDPLQVIDFWFAPGPFQDYVENWVDVVFAILAVLRRDATRCPTPELEAALLRAEQYTQKLERPPVGCALPVICPIINFQGQRIRTISSMMRFETATNVTAESLKVELFFPVDEVGEAFFAQIAAS